MDRRHPLSAPVRTGPELARYEYVDVRVRDVALAFGGREVQYSALIATEVLERAEYPKAFPHLLLSANRHQAQAETEWCLSPAVCYHVYADMACSAPREPQVLTARGRCFRHERECSPGVRQVEFTMREIVLLGPAPWVRESADAIAHAIESLARDLGLDGDWRQAIDPFFLPAAQGKAAMQQLMKAKHEYQLRDQEGLALASINRHGTFFGERFDITTSDGEPLHSACLAVGLDRWAHHARSMYPALRTAARVEEEVRS